MRGLLLVHLAASPLVFSTGNVDPFEFVKAALLVAAASAAGTAALVSRLWAFPAAIGVGRRDPVLLAGGVLLAVSAGASALFAISPLTALRGAEGSFAGVVTLSALAVVFLATRRAVVTDGDERAFLGAVPWATAGVCTYALIQIAGLDPLRWLGAASLDDAIRPFSTLGHPNHLAAWLAVAAPLLLLSLFEAVRDRRRGRALAMGLVLAASSVTVLVTLSRGGWAAMAVGLAVTMAAAPGKGRGARVKKILIVSILAVAGLVAPFLALRSSISTRLASRIGRAADMGARGEIWKGALGIFLAHPFVGCGLDNFGLAWGEERTARYRKIECDRTPTRAHDDVLHLLATQGVLGLLAVSVAVTGVGRRLRSLLRGPDGDGSARAAALAGSLAAFLVQGLAGFTVIPVAVLVVSIVALVLREPLARGRSAKEASAVPPTKEGNRQLSLATVALVFGVLVGGLAWFFLARVFLADYFWRKASLAGNRSTVGVELLRRAQALDPARDVLEVALGESARQLAATVRDPVGRKELRVVASEAYDRATQLVPAGGYNWLGAARLRRDQFRDGEASLEDVDRAFEAALSRDPRNASFLADAANAMLEAGGLERGEAFAVRSASAYPDYGPPVGQLGFVALTRGQSMEARRMLERSLGLDWCGQESARAVTLSNAAAAAAAEGDGAAAVRWARESLQIEPSSVEARYNLARALEGLGRLEEARLEYRKVVEGAPDHPRADRARRKLSKLDLP